MLESWPWFWYATFCIVAMTAIGAAIDLVLAPLLLGDEDHEAPEKP